MQSSRNTSRQTYQRVKNDFVIDPMATSITGSVLNELDQQHTSFQHTKEPVQKLSIPQKNKQLTSALSKALIQAESANGNMSFEL